MAKYIYHPECKNLAETIASVKRMHDIKVEEISKQRQSVREREREKAENISMKNGNGSITIDPTDIKKI